MKIKTLYRENRKWQRIELEHLMGRKKDANERDMPEKTNTTFISFQK